jgi:hypothetical protein
LDPIEEPLDLDRASIRKLSAPEPTGEGRGVISSIAAICGDAITDPGDSEPAAVCSLSRTLGTLRGRLEAELLCRSNESELSDLVVLGYDGTTISVRICRSARKP